MRVLRGLLIFIALSIGIGMVMLISPPLSRAQSATTAKSKFEVASIRPCKPGVRGGTAAAGTRGTGDTVVLRRGTLYIGCQPLRVLVHMAYFDYANGHHNLNSFVPISGGPDWVYSEGYQIDAKAEGDASYEMMHGPMLQTLLEDRFTLKTHFETRDVQVFAMTMAKGGPKNLQSSKDGGCRPLLESTIPTPLQAPGQPGLPICGNGGGGRSGPNRICDFWAMNMDRFSEWLRDLLGRPVINKTGLDGKFDFHLEFALDDSIVGPVAPERPEQQALHANDPAGPSFFVAIQEQLGLKLEPVKGPGQFFVIDHAEKPSEGGRNR
jgi:uncharacterized protein (TIGR03435 family)